MQAQAWMSLAKSWQYVLRIAMRLAAVSTSMRNLPRR
jgi:hypothetical protein